MREFFATILALIVIIGTLWIIFAILGLGVSVVSSWGVSPGLLYFLAGCAFGMGYRHVGIWLANYCDSVWEKISDWLVCR
jgi:uncharacterized membrane protein YedE/YeeE